jgi:hypothetical protein
VRTRLSRQQTLEALRQGHSGKATPNNYKSFGKVWHNDLSVTSSYTIFLCRFPRHEPTEDPVLIGDELEVGVQLEGDVPTADIDLSGWRR